jgi:hypothetical protein
MLLMLHPLMLLLQPHLDMAHEQHNGYITGSDLHGTLDTQQQE